MLAAHLTELLDTTPAGVSETLDIVAGFDDALAHGLARPDATRAAALEGLAGALAGTPLGAAVGEAVEALSSGSLADGHLAALAGARTALLGAVHDALVDSLDAARGVTRDTWSASAQAPSPAEPADDKGAAGSRAWLGELAVTGWLGVDRDLASGANQTIEALLADPAQRRLAVLLDGLTAELQALCPAAAVEQVPVRRWADLWARAVLLSHDSRRYGPCQAATEVSGRLLPLGVDVHEHGTAVQAQVHCVFEPADGGPPRLLCASLTAAKVDAIVGPAVWRLLADHPVLLGALAERRSLTITDMPLLAGGDLLWHDDRAGAGEEVDPFATARLHLADAVAPAVAPLDRHPVRIAEPVFIEGYTTDATSGLTVDLGGATLPVDLDRLPACGPLTPKLVADSTACIGLLRWDAGQWSLQPLAVRTKVKRKPATVQTGDWALGPTDPKVAKVEERNNAVAVLRERAGRLLRG
ncbi:hypothetical protein [Salinactinospora qingdaonensis]|uniref:DUF222 domain-containing protein n=1 Tax=Salinactinospora qingdaonensis TaxID=702744 RepID=A0ABP7FYU1_9ACTN